MKTKKFYNKCDRQLFTNYYGKKVSFMKFGSLLNDNSIHNIFISFSDWNMLKPRIMTSIFMEFNVFRSIQMSENIFAIALNYIYFNYNLPNSFNLVSNKSIDWLYISTGRISILQYQSVLNENVKFRFWNRILSWK